MKSKYPFKISKEGMEDLQSLKDARIMLEKLTGKYLVMIESNKNLNKVSDNHENIALRNRANQHYRNFIDNLKPIIEKISS